MNERKLRTTILYRQAKIAKKLAEARLKVTRLEEEIKELVFQSKCVHELVSNNSGMQLITHTCTKCGFEIEE